MGGGGGGKENHKRNKVQDPATFFRSLKLRASTSAQPFAPKMSTYVSYTIPNVTSVAVSHKKCHAVREFLLVHVIEELTLERTIETCELWKATFYGELLADLPNHIALKLVSLCNSWPNAVKGEEKHTCWHSLFTQLTATFLTLTLVWRSSKESWIVQLAYWESYNIWMVKKKYNFDTSGKTKSDPWRWSSISSLRVNGGLHSMQGTHGFLHTARVTNFWSSQ